MVRQDISFLQAEIEYIKHELYEIRTLLWKLSSSIDSLKSKEKEIPKPPIGLQDFLKLNGFKLPYDFFYDNKKKYY